MRVRYEIRWNRLAETLAMATSLAAVLAAVTRII